MTQTHIADGTDPCEMRTSHVLIVTPASWLASGLAPDEVTDFWTVTPEGDYLMGVAELGPASFPSALIPYVEWDALIGEWWINSDGHLTDTEHDAAYDALQGCQSPNGHPADPRTCSGRVFWIDNQGTYACEGHGPTHGYRVRDLTDAERGAATP